MKKILRKVYRVLSYICFVLVLFSILLNITSFIINCFFDSDFTVDIWEILYLIPIVIFTVRCYHPIV